MTKKKEDKAPEEVKETKAVSKTASKEVKETKAVSKTASKEVAEYDYGADAGSGFEDISADELSVPFIKLAANLSPEIDETEPEYIEGLQEGMFFNAASKEIYTEFDFVPVKREHVFLEYVPRDDGGGFVGAHDPASPKIQELKKEHGAYGVLPTEDGTEIQENYSVYGILVDKDGNEKRAVIGFTSTKIKPYRDWMTAAMEVKMIVNGRKIPMPLFAHKYHFSSVKQRNKKGKFHNIKITFTGGRADKARLTPNDPLYLAAKEFKTMLDSGMAKADHNTTGTDEEIPF